MRRNRPLFLFLLLACVAPAGLAPVSACPQVQVTSPDLVTAGDALEITVVVTGGDPDVTATVDVGGYARDCATSSSSTTTVEAKGGNEPAKEEPAPEKPPR
jgi:hypothetical protein